MLELAPNNPYGLSLRSPLVAAAGSLGYGLEFARMFDLRQAPGEHGLGLLISRTTTLHPRRGPLPQLLETPAGLLYSGVGYNPGLRTVLERYAPLWAKWELPVVLSIGGARAAECAEIATHLEGVEGVAGVELNLALLDVSPSQALAGAVAVVRAATLLPLLVKLPVDAANLVELAVAVAAAGADALSLCGGFAARTTDSQTGATLDGLLCGPATRPLAMPRVAAVAQAVSIPVVGGGGVGCNADVQAFLAAGAMAVSLGSALLADPRAAGRVLQTLELQTLET
ncbi:MAG: HisA/HisF-related TIM barrel protein [Chloroflexaceae bacterium]|jgi:dihydroorotate dehydrogenase (NAD+) catalytic subunit|nr:HisA/HisF-related TIM barrel protein [Chloroflexaceae bacterium]